MTSAITSRGKSLQLCEFFTHRLTSSESPDDGNCWPLYMLVLRKTDFCCLMTTTGLLQ